MSFAAYEQDKKRDKRLRLTLVPSTDGKPAIEIFSLDKRKIAEELIDRFSRNPHEADSFNFKKLDLSNTNLAGLDLGVLGEKALRQIDFTGANMPGQNFSGMNLRGAMFKGAHMEGTHFEGCVLDNANLENATLSRSNFEGCSAIGARMNYVKANGSCLDGNFRGAQLNAADLSGCFLGSANFENAQMANSNLSGAVNYGTVNFSHAILASAKLNGDFRNANFCNAMMDGADMEGGEFNGAQFNGATVNNVKTAFAKLDADAFEGTVSYGDLETKLDVALPKPSFNSKAKKLQAVLNQIGPEAPNLATFQAQKHRQHLDNFPKCAPPSM